MTNIIQDVNPIGTASAYVEKSFDKAKAELEDAGYEIISLEQFAKLRIEQGKNSHVANYGAYTREGFLYIPRKGIFLVKNSPIMDNPREAVECHRKGNEFYLTQEQTEKSLVDSVQVKMKSGETIPTKGFGDNELTVYAFGNTAKAYGEFLKEAGIKEMPIYLTEVTNNVFARQVWLHRLVGYQSALYNDDGGLGCSNAVRGVRLTSLTRSAKNSDSDSEKYVKIIQGVRKGDLPASKLEEVLEYFSKQ